MMTIAAIVMAWEIWGRRIATRRNVLMVKLWKNSYVRFIVATRTLNLTMGLVTIEV
jgi:hypothetical protein